MTKAQLLPLPVDQVRALALKHHLALAMLRDDRGDIEAIITLLNVLYLAFVLRDSGSAALDSCRRAEVALDECTRRAERGEPWSLADAERQVLEQLVVTHNAQLAAAPAHRYLDAWEQVQSVMASGDRSPIPAAA